MSETLEIIAGDETVDLDRWCDLARVEGKFLIGTMRFGPEVVGTDTQEIIAAKREDSATEFDRFFDAIEQFVGTKVAVIYAATKVAEVVIPQDGGINASGTEIRWEVARVEPISHAQASSERVTPARTDMEQHERLQAEYEVIEAMGTLETAIKELTSAINGKKKS